MSPSIIAPGRAIAALAGRDTTLVVRLPFLDWTGDLYASLMLDEGLFTSGRIGGDGWFARTDEEWARLFRASVYAVRAARARLLQLKIIETRRQGMPKRTFYRFDPAQIEASFVTWLDAADEAQSIDESAGDQAAEDPGAGGSTADSAAQSCENEGLAMRKRTAGHVNPEVQSCDSARPSIPAVKSLKQHEDTTPADAGVGGSAAAAPTDRDAPVTDQRATFTALCRAAGWSFRDLTPGNREQLGQLAARVLEEPSDARPSPDELAEVYRAAHRALSDRLGRDAGDLTIQQFRQAIGGWVEARRQTTEDRQRRAEQALREAEADHRRAAELAAAGPVAEASGPAAAIWNQIAAALRAWMSPATWNTWLAQARPASLRDGVLTVQVPSSYHVDWITSRLAEQLTSLSEDAGLEDLRFVVADAAGEERAA